MGLLIVNLIVLNVTPCLCKSFKVNLKKGSPTSTLDSLGEGQFCVPIQLNPICGTTRTGSTEFGLCSSGSEGEKKESYKKQVRTLWNKRLVDVRDMMMG